MPISACTSRSGRSRGSSTASGLEGASHCLGVGIVIIFLCVTKSRQTYIKTNQTRPFEEWIEKGHQRAANLCGAYARPTDTRSLVRGGGRYNQGSFVYFAKACGGWVFAGVNGVGCVDVEGGAVLSDG